MAVTVTHTKVSTIPDDADTSLIRPSDWNATHTLSGVGTMATQDANAVAITGGTMSGVTVTGYIPTTDRGAVNGVASLDGSGTVPISQLPAAVLGALSYQGIWNASTNTPTLASSTGTKGYYYVVNVAGSTTLNGISDWQVGDWAVYNGSAWQKIDNTDAVTSVNGYTGTVVLTAADVGAVPYTGATAAVDLNNKSLTDISHLGINTTSVPDILIRAFGDNNSASRIAVRGYSSDANSSAMRVAKFRGTYASPQAPLSGDSLGKFELAGYGTTSSSGYPQASLEGVATENWGATARGTKAIVKVTPNTTTTQVTALTIDQNSAATFASTVTANGVLLTGNTGTVTSVAATASTGISISGSPITTSGTLTITNTAPDQTVAFTNGTGISVTGTYPNFTVTNTSPSSGGTVTSVTGTAPVVSSGGNTPAISMAAATTSVSGYLTSTDWNTFNNKGSGTVTSVSATAPITSSGGATPNLAMPAATTSVSGYLTSTDWTTFNGKQATLVSGTNIKTINTNSILGSGDLTIAATPAGSTTQVQYNNSGAFAGSANLTFNGTNLSVGGSVNSTNTFGFKNRLINGGMVIDQRNVGASVSTTTTGTPTYTLDRWAYQASQASKYTVQQNAGSVTPPVGFGNYLGVTSTSAYSVASGDYFLMRQPIEGFNTADLMWGTANAKTVTLSFWVYSSLTGTFGGALANSGNSRSYPFSYSIPTANTWTQISITIAGDTSGTWIGATNGLGILVAFGLGVGSTYSNTAGAWATGNYLSATGATSVVGTSGATFYITGIQLEVGSQATSFDFRDYGRELILCQRYYTNTGGYNSCVGNAGLYSSPSFSVVMRTIPTMTVTTTSGTNTIELIGARGCYIYSTGTNGFQYTASAEL